MSSPQMTNMFGFAFAIETSPQWIERTRGSVAQVPFPAGPEFLRLLKHDPILAATLTT